MAITFRFIEFNERRALRGAPAARVGIIEDDAPEEWCWMTRRDSTLNLKQFGDDAELLKAKAAYGAWQ